MNTCVRVTSLVEIVMKLAIRKLTRVYLILESKSYSEMCAVGTRPR